MKALYALSLLVCVNLFAVDSRIEKAIKAFSENAAVRTTIASLKQEGWEVAAPTAAIYSTVWQDEGTAGKYLISLFAAKGKPPVLVETKTITGIIEINAGHIKSVKLVDSFEVEKALFNLE